ncbi:hypothetical protein GCM10009787_77820 [Streptomyces bangladeshensis]|uniref:Uncharacterized protein n=1 Tax=Streptomyces bangladeshensis TaxID=295352 RepID=A0ABN1ZK41_9ACTN
MTVQIAEELARLHRLVSGFEVPPNLPSSALAGEAFVWCASPADVTFVELEPSVELPRWGCMACYTSRVAWYITWYDWHVPSAAACSTWRISPVARDTTVPTAISKDERASPPLSFFRRAACRPLVCCSCGMV